MISKTRNLLVAVCDDGDDPTAPRLHLLHVGDDLLIHGVPGRDDDHRHQLVDQRDGTVFHLGRRIPLRVDIGDLFELECPFQRDREVVTAAEIEGVRAAGELFG